MTLPRLIAICGLVALGMTSVEAADDPGGPASPDAKAATFEGQVLPVLSRYCTDCHGKAKPKAGLDLIGLHRRRVRSRGARRSGKAILDHVEGRIMPPEDRPQPSEAEFDALTGWIQAELQKGQCEGPVDPGRVTIRRLNRAEYANTIRDLIGIEFRMTDDFPSDDVGYGFDNIGDVLSMPPLLLEKYMAAAEKIASQAIVTELPWKGTVQAWEAEDLGRGAGGSRLKDVGRVLASTGEIQATATLPDDGAYFLRVKAFGQQAGPDPRGWRSGSMARRSGKSTSRPSKGRPGLTRSASRRRRAPGNSPSHSSTTITRPTAPHRTGTGTSSSTRSRCKGRSSRTRATCPSRTAASSSAGLTPATDASANAPGRSSSGSPAVPIAVPRPPRRWIGWPGSWTWP